eukprot:GFUD01067371.1.p1 GENE.GFUD01067371.1~~GFUD01067371.1.p1  ORF type:complete len:257 (-),score=47.34 GFUD01067371.1:217-987(-)
MVGNTKICFILVLAGYGEPTPMQDRSGEDTEPTVNPRTRNHGPGSGTSSDWSYCSNSSPCTAGHGDCDSDAQCAGSLTCGQDNCKDFNSGAHRQADCCIGDSTVVIWGMNWKGAWQNDATAAYNVLTDGKDSYNEKTGKANYWLSYNTPLPGYGELSSLFYDIGKTVTVTGFRLTNTHNWKDQNSGTKKFTIFAKKLQAEPWDEIKTATLPDPRNVEQNVQEIPLPSSVKARFIRFTVDSYYGQYCGGLQYFAPVY